MKYLSLIIKVLFLVDAVRSALADGRLTEEEVHSFVEKGSAILLSQVTESVSSV
jgi:hypothetical protein